MASPPDDLTLTLDDPEIDVAARSTETESSLDRITSLAATALRVPISAITVLGPTTAHFPAASVTLATQDLPRSEVFCTVTQELGEIVVVEDARLDSRFRHLRAVREQGIVFYAGFPLFNRHGAVVATLCLLDVRPRTLDEHDLSLMKQLSAWAEEEMVASAEMRLAAEAQAYLLPAGPLHHQRWRLHGMCTPAFAVGGDFYDYDIADDVATLRLGDVMGKGTPAALMGAGVRAALRGTNAAVTAGVDLGVTVTRTAQSLYPDLERASSFVTLFEAAVDLLEGSLRYVDAGSGMAMVLAADGSYRHLSSQDPPLGVLNDDHWTEHYDRLDPGDRLLVFSDGLLDLVGDGPGWQERVAELARTHPEPEQLFAEVTRLAGTQHALDDVTVTLLIRAAGGPG